MNDAFVNTIIALRSNEGKKWLESIPNLIGAYEEKWSIKVFEPFTLSYNYVASAKRNDGTEVVLKIGFKGDTEFISEMEALSLFKGQGAINILAEDRANAVVLLEKVLPGTPLSQLSDDEQATQIAAQVAKNLWKPTHYNSSLIPLDRWFKGFERLKTRYKGNTGSLPEKIVTKGEALFKQLLATTKQPMLIHGDFHHDNILSSKRNNWLVIDPKGVVGDPIYDVAVFLYNPITKLSNAHNLKEILQKRIEIFSDELDIDKRRIIEWGIAQSVLSAIWTIEDNGTGWEHTIHCAEVLLEL